MRGGFIRKNNKRCQKKDTKTGLKGASEKGKRDCSAEFTAQKFRTSGRYKGKL